MVQGSCNASADTSIPLKISVWLYDYSLSPEKENGRINDTLLLVIVMCVCTAADT